MKKLLSMLLAGLMMISLVACGTGESKSPEETKGNSSAVTEGETVDNRYQCELPDNLSFKDEVVHIIYAKVVGRDDELVSEGAMNEKSLVSTAVYERNELVQSQLGVQLDMIPEDGLVADKVTTDIKSGNGDYDIVVNGTYMAIAPATRGEYLDLNKLEHIDTSKHYWTQGYNEMVTFTSENRQFLASGPIAISMFRLMYLTIYNKTLFENYKETDLHEVVMNGQWTLDYQYSILKDKYVDSDGNSKKSEGDTYGFVSGNCISVDPYPVAGNVHMIVKDPDTYDLRFNSEAISALSDLVDKVQLIFNDQSTFVFKDSAMDDVGKNNIVETFALGKSMMATIMFWNMEHNFEDLASMSYGIAPIPKYSELQDRYYSYVQDQVSSFGISAAIGNADRQSMLSAVLESMAYYSYQKVRPAYYENTLSTRYMNDPESQETLTLIFDSLYFDFSSSCSNMVTGCVIRDNLRPIFGGVRNTVSSTTKRWEKSVNSALKKYNESLNKIE